MSFPTCMRVIFLKMLISILELMCDHRLLSACRIYLICALYLQLKDGHQTLSQAQDRQEEDEEVYSSSV